MTEEDPLETMEVPLDGPTKLAGGLSPDETNAFASPTVACTLEGVYFVGFPLSFSPPVLYNATTSVQNVVVNADASIAEVSPRALPNDASVAGYVETAAVALAPGDSIDLVTRAPLPQVCIAFAVAQT